MGLFDPTPPLMASTPALGPFPSNAPRPAGFFATVAEPAQTPPPAADYYKEGGLETIDILKAKLSTEQFEGFCLGNVYKYLTRAGKKPDNSKSDDFKKAYYYLGLLAGPKE
ncbi:uncharacterized protein SPPG_00932 [Spizellomyces punctatus DAOM BR117]|uniref:DUF3310 domain-containing protein n=1 Tax=Spizellomyces punctatus (strain DAOM BR117) TaxID=645134 RepID=A0A0L0HRE5_SPIPD|nr:uncharacterized protein SPPG_00932 [Spizellomyces punctatus DAOM BR117]KND03449.1 hypothetical protein SPPG_00932 [Spizellomyces punctatus DAOM BR117]|eukprot:XP_016611488.1 hypothetical protein SPPG_00932 [Spizellomyces punctatus DAOM BR117]